MVFLTDAQLHAPPDVARAFLEWKARVRARLISLVVGGRPGDLARLSDEAHTVRALGGSEAAGLDESAARALAPRHAFSRACKRLAKRRIIRQTAEDADTITFQLIAESRAGDRYEYTLETMLTLRKADGVVSCPLAGLAAHARELLDETTAARTGGDVTRVVQRLFERRADLFLIRDKGGVYFVPQEHAASVDRVQSFLGGVNGRLARFPVPAGTARGDASVKDAVAGGIAALIAEHREAIAAFGADTRASTLERAAARVRAVRHKVASYAAYLQDERERLEDDLAETAAQLRARVEALAAPDDGPAVPA